mmetsp:Transcript_1086/g.3170  ORF Transcript_1086/g.3170 Transcript_1086/m.3170 type:complete len:237 (+) Transcript_1086:1178-1888(+)
MDTHSISPFLSFHSTPRYTSLCLLDDADFRGSQHTAVEHESDLHDLPHGAWLLFRIRILEQRLVLGGIEDVAGFLAKLGQTILSERLEETVLRHFDAFVERGQHGMVLGILAQFFRHGIQGARQVVGDIEQGLGKFLNGKVAGRLDIALGDAADVFLLGIRTQESLLQFRHLLLELLQFDLLFIHGFLLGCGFVLGFGFICGRGIGLVRRLGVVAFLFVCVGRRSKETGIATSWNA